MSALARACDVPTTWAQLSAGPLALIESGPPSGVPVVLVPGFTGSKEDFAPLLAPLAAAGYRAIALDQRGQYESPGPDDPAAYTLERLAAELLELFDLLALGALHLVGHSFGGLVCRAAALSASTLPGGASGRGAARLRSLTLLGSGPAGLGGERGEAIASLRPLALGQSDPAFWVSISELVATEEFGRRRFLASSRAGLVGMGDALVGELDRTEELRATGLPVLVAHGATDDAWSPQLQRTMAERLGARYAVIEHAAHSPAVEDPEATAGVLLDFFTGVDRGQA